MEQSFLTVLLGSLFSWVWVPQVTIFYLGLGFLFLSFAPGTAAPHVRKMPSFWRSFLLCDLCVLRDLCVSLSLSLNHFFTPSSLSPMYNPSMWKTLRYYWIAARGYRLQPWNSPYLQWRFETFLGKEAAHLDARKFLQLAWKYRDNLRSFADWSAQRRRVMRTRA